MKLIITRSVFSGPDFDKKVSIKKIPNIKGRIIYSNIEPDLKGTNEDKYKSIHNHIFVKSGYKILLILLNKI